MSLPARVLLALAVLVLAWLLLGGDAAAASESQMANIQPASLALLEYALAPAVAYWQAEGRVLDCKPQLHLYDERGRDRSDVVARADMPGCNIYWNRRVLRDTLREVYDPWRGLAAQGLRSICQTTAHEMGHNLGLEHTEHGLMDPSGGTWEWAFKDGTRVGGWVRECKLWARAILSARRERMADCETKRCVRRITQRRVDTALAGL